MPTGAPGLCSLSPRTFKWRMLVEDGRKTGHAFSQPDLVKKLL
jgi:hypothetical protein